jgi:hypothetical protein
MSVDRKFLMDRNSVNSVARELSQIQMEERRRVVLKLCG